MSRCRLHHATFALIDILFQHEPYHVSSIPYIDGYMYTGFSSDIHTYTHMKNLALAGTWSVLAYGTCVERYSSMPTRIHVCMPTHTHTLTYIKVKDTDAGLHASKCTDGEVAGHLLDGLVMLSTDESSDCGGLIGEPLVVICARARSSERYECARVTSAGSDMRCGQHTESSSMRRRVHCSRWGSTLSIHEMRVWIARMRSDSAGLSCCDSHMTSSPSCACRSSVCVSKCIHAHMSMYFSAMRFSNFAEKIPKGHKTRLSKTRQAFDTLSRGMR
jgi:hypothetical protein